MKPVLMLIAAAGLALLATACSGSPTTATEAGATQTSSAVTYSHCLRSHGVPGWPDPSIDSEGRPVFNLIPAGITHSQTHSPPISNKLAECGRLDPATVAMES